MKFVQVIDRQVLSLTDIKKVLGDKLDDAMFMKLYEFVSNVTDTPNTSQQNTESKETKERVLTDTDIMTYGKHKGTMLKDVPTDYFAHMYETGKLFPSFKTYYETQVLNKQKVKF